MPTSTVRPGIVTDAIDLAALDVDARSELMQLFPGDTSSAPPSLGEWAALWHERLDIAHGDDYFVLVVETADDHELCGYITGGGSRDHDGKSGAEIYSLYVAAHLRRKGYGTLLLHRGLQVMKAAQYGAATIWVPSNNNASIDFFHRNGFQPEKGPFPQDIEGYEVPSDRCRLNF